MGATDAVKDDVCALGRQAANLVDEVEMLVVNRDSAQIGNGRRASR